MRHAIAAATLAISLVSPCASAAKVEEKRAEVRATTHRTLERLYAIQPEAKGTVARAAGHAVFTNFGLKLFLVGGGSGEGIAIDRASGAETFMKMIELQAGIGFGIKRFALVWVFDTKEAFDSFVGSGWEIGAQATAAAQYNDVGAAHAGAVAVSSGVWLYQLAGDGLALELTAKGTRYYKDDSLN